MKMIKLATLNSEGLSSSSHNLSRNNVEFTSSSPPSFSPTKTRSLNTDQMFLLNNDKPGLKLVFKKSSENQYQIKNIYSPSVYSKNSNTPSNTNNEVKFIQFESNLKYKPKSNTQVKRYSKEVFATTREESNDQDFVEICTRSKKRKLSKNDENNHRIKITCPNIFKSASFKKTLSLPKVKAMPKKIYCDEKAEVLEPFFRNELHYKGFGEKLRIYQDKPKVVLQLTKLGLVLCEESSNIIRSKAILHYHLFISNTSPCIYCSYCNIYLSVNEFSKHICTMYVTIDDFDDPFDVDEQKAAKKILDSHKLKILPLAENDELNKFELEIWDLFSQKYTLFKNKAKKEIDSLNKDAQNSFTKKTFDSKAVRIKRSTQMIENFSCSLSDDEFEMDSTSKEPEKQVSQNKSGILVELSNFKEDIMLSDEE